MKPIHLKAVLVLLLMLAAFAGAQAWRPTSRLADTRPKVELETMFPKAFGAWQINFREAVSVNLGVADAGLWQGCRLISPICSRPL